MIHQNLVAEASEFVSLEMENEWVQGVSVTITLPEDEPETFAVYQTWLYEGCIQAVGVADADRADDEYQLLVKAYMLGDKMMDTTFKDALVDSIIDKLIVSGRFDLNLIDLIYGNTPATSPLRRLLRDIYGWAGQRSWLDSIDSDEPLQAEFMKELLQYHMGFHRTAGVQAAPFLSQTTCMYHEHGDRTCYKVRVFNVT